MKIGVVTTGADAPGGNPAVRSIVRYALRQGIELVGIRKGFLGFLNDDIIVLTSRSVSGILPAGGTILGSSTFDPTANEEDIAIIKDEMERYGIDYLVVVGDRPSLIASYKLYQSGINVIGIPQTIDNDIVGTDTTIGFNTAVTTVAEALDRLHTTAESHHRVMVVEVMGGDVGWLALIGGITGGADYIIIPEIPLDIDKLIDHIMDRKKRGKDFSIIVVAEGADIPGKEENGVGNALKKLISERGNFEARATVLGHQLRGGSPTVTDRLLATRMGIKAVDAILSGENGVFVGIEGESISTKPLEIVIEKPKYADIKLYEEAAIFF
ncbi:ATP-dependent 6-phosphofructokinase [bacterium 3DAC]|jgi:6-phosphofructokinase 1|nr:6-phosphofructokinase [Dictyoglomota bacterium]UZN23348.1 ATP-dependent 6-phosphofructokinase [bacterium 3DAC]